jgi:hypothetical protein
LPLGTAGGRGFNIPITLNYSGKVWSTAHDTTVHPTTLQSAQGTVYGQPASNGEPKRSMRAAASSTRLKEIGRNARP